MSYKSCPLIYVHEMTRVSGHKGVLCNKMGHWVKCLGDSDLSVTDGGGHTFRNLWFRVNFMYFQNIFVGCRKPFSWIFYKNMYFYGLFSESLMVIMAYVYMHQTLLLCFIYLLLCSMCPFIGWTPFISWLH